MSLGWRSVVDDVFRVIAEWQPITLTTARWSLLFSRWSDPIELYDLEHDADQTRNVAAERPDVVRELHARLVAELVAAGTSEADLAPRR